MYIAILNWFVKRVNNNNRLKFYVLRNCSSLWFWMSVYWQRKLRIKLNLKMAKFYRMLCSVHHFYFSLNTNEASKQTRRTHSLWSMHFCTNKDTIFTGIKLFFFSLFDSTNIFCSQNSGCNIMLNVLTNHTFQFLQKNMKKTKKKIPTN